MMTTRTTICLVIVLNFSAITAVSQMYTKDKQDAEKAWEALIRAKGGRERLHSIKSILIDDTFRIRLFVFPNDQWEFLAKDVFGRPSRLAVVSDGSTMLQYSENESGFLNTNTYDPTSYLADVTTNYLLESKWYKPEPTQVRREMRDKKPFEVLSTRNARGDIDFVYDPEDMLITEIRYRSSAGAVTLTHCFSDYVEVSGIKMPQTEGQKLGGLNPDKQCRFHHVHFEFNVDYDPDLFTRRPIVVSQDGWKHRKN